jgi:hypothetical protein
MVRFRELFEQEKELDTALLAGRSSIYVIIYGYIYVYTCV